MEAVFLGMNKAGEEVYDWLNSREDVKVLALLTEKEQLSLIEDLQPEIVISSGFEHKVPKEVIEAPEKGIVNLHPSFLPYNRGSHPYIWPIVDDTPAGVSIHYMDEEIDQGPIIDRKEVPVFNEDTAESLHERLMDEQVELFKENWSIIKKGPEGREQDGERGNTHYRDELDELREIKLGEETTAGELIDRLRALTYPPHRNAYFERNGEKYFIDVDITPEDGD